MKHTDEARAALAVAGIVGSDADTSLASIARSLHGSSNGRLDFALLAGELRQSHAGLTTEQRHRSLAIMFGTDAVRAASVLYVNGADGIRAHAAANG